MPKSKITLIFLTLFLATPFRVFSSSQDCKKELSLAKRFYKLSQQQATKNKKARKIFLKKALAAISRCNLFNNSLKIKILVSLGDILAKKDIKGAVKLLEKARDLERMEEYPNSFTFTRLAEAYCKSSKDKPGNIAKAKEAYEEALDINSFSSESLKEKTKEALRHLLHKF